MRAADQGWSTAIGWVGIGEGGIQPSPNRKAIGKDGKSMTMWIVEDVDGRGPGRAGSEIINIRKGRRIRFRGRILKEKGESRGAMEDGKEISRKTLSGFRTSNRNTSKTGALDRRGRVRRNF